MDYFIFCDLSHTLRNRNRLKCFPASVCHQPVRNLTSLAETLKFSFGGHSPQLQSGDLCRHFTKVAGPSLYMYWGLTSGLITCTGFCNSLVGNFDSSPKLLLTDIDERVPQHVSVLSDGRVSAPRRSLLHLTPRNLPEKNIGLILHQDMLNSRDSVIKVTQHAA